MEQTVPEKKILTGCTGDMIETRATILPQNTSAIPEALLTSPVLVGYVKVHGIWRFHCISKLKQDCVFSFGTSCTARTIYRIVRKWPALSALLLSLSLFGMQL